MTVQESYDWAIEEGVADAEIEVIDGHEDIVILNDPEVTEYGNGDICVSLFE